MSDDRLFLVWVLVAVAFVVTIISVITMSDTIHNLENEVDCLRQQGEYTQGDRVAVCIIDGDIAEVY